MLWAEEGAIKVSRLDIAGDVQACEGGGTSAANCWEADRPAVWLERAVSPRNHSKQSDGVGRRGESRWNQCLLSHRIGFAMCMQIDKVSTSGSCLSICIALACGSSS